MSNQSATSGDDSRSVQAGFWYGLRLMPGSIWLPLAALSLLAMGVFFFNDWVLAGARQSANTASRLMSLQQGLVNYRSTLTDAEAAQRGYLLTHDERYLNPYNRAVEALPALTGDNRVLAQGDPEILQRLEELDMIRGKKMEELSATVALAQQGARPEALDLLRSGDGRRMMDEFRISADALLTYVGSKIADAGKSQTRNVRLSRMASGTLAVLTFVLLILVVRLFVGEGLHQERLRRADELQRLRLESVVNERTHELSLLTTYLQNVLEQEKSRLARDLHDELGGLLTAAKMDLAWLQGRAVALDDVFRGKLDDLARGLTEAMNLKRRVVESLRPALLDHFGLPTALQAYFDESCRKAGLNCTANIPEELEQLPPEIAIALFRVGQESLTNIIRHARARNVELSLDADADNYRVRIIDDGAGMDLDQVRASHGLSGMRHRITSLGGQFAIVSAPGRGTRIEISVPRRPVQNEVAPEA